MILSTHGIVGGAMAIAAGANPVAAIAIGWTSHYFMDLIPHWDYHLHSAQADFDNSLNNNFVLGEDSHKDIIKLSLDVFFAFFLPILFFADFHNWISLLIISAGAFGGLLPDFFQVVYMKLRFEPFKTLQRIHFAFHSTNQELKKQSFLGFSLQLLIIIVAFFFGNWRIFQ